MTRHARYFDAAGDLRLGELEVRADGALRIRPDSCTGARADPLVLRPAPSVLSGGIVTGHFTDWHVHLQLIDATELDDGPIGRVLDLGGTPETIRALRDRGQAAELRSAVQIDFAGAFLTAPGGYPSDRSWAPPGSFRELRTVSDAAAAVAEMASLGASHIKVASNSAAGPVLSDELFRAVVAAATVAGLPVVAHAEGPGEAMRVFELGATWYAHTPFSERLSEDELRVLANGAIWISTLDIHGWGAPDEEFQIALDNLAGFARLGGRVRYGTDLGNGPLPTRLNARELAGLGRAGLSPAAQLAALTPADPTRDDSVLLWVPGDGMEHLDLAAARPLTSSTLPDSGDIR